MSLVSGYEGHQDELIFDKCHKCALHKKKEHPQKIDSKLLTPYPSQNPDILFIFENPGHRNELSGFIQWLTNITREFKFSWAGHNGLQCSTTGNGPEKTVTTYELYGNCNTVTEKLISKINPKVIMPIGKAITAITKTDDISWTEFIEYCFNQTFFYTPVSWEKIYPVVPIPSLSTWVRQANSFEHQFTNYQMQVAMSLFNKTFKREPWTISVVEDVNTFLIENTGKHRELVIDSETNSIDTFKDNFKIACLSLAFNTNKAYVLPWEKVDKSILDKFLDSIPIHILAEAKYDARVLRLNGINNIKLTHDVITAHHLLNTERRFNSIKSLAWLIKMGYYDAPLDQVRKKHGIKDYTMIPDDVLFPYAGLDAIVTFRLHRLAQEGFKLQPDIKPAYNQIMSVHPCYLDMELLGMPVSVKKIEKLNSELKQEAAEIAQKVYQAIGRKFDLNSPEKLGKVLEEVGYPCYERTAKGFYSTKEEFLTYWAKEGLAGAAEILEYRGTRKLMDAFVGTEGNDIDPDSLFSLTPSNYEDSEDSEGIIKFLKSDGMIHPLYGVGRTDSMRSRCNSPNIQQAPKRGKEGERFRHIFEAPEGYDFFEADQSGFQLRIACILSEDPTMYKIFHELSGDMHSITAQGVFARDTSLEEFLSNKKKPPFADYRQKAKTINFAFLFGASPTTLFKFLKNEWSEQELYEYINSNHLILMLDRNEMPDIYLTVATDIRKKFFETYTYLESWFEKQHSFARKYGYVDTLIGGRRHLPILRLAPEGFDKKLEKNLLNKSVNSPVQGFESLIMYESMTNIYNEIKKRKMKSSIRVMIHDSIGGLVHHDEKEELFWIIKNNMDFPNRFSVPLECEIDYGPVWGFGKKVDTTSFAN